MKSDDSKIRASSLKWSAIGWNSAIDSARSDSMINVSLLFFFLLPRYFSVFFPFFCSFRDWYRSVLVIVVIDSGVAVKSYFSGSAFVIARGWPHPESPLGLAPFLLTLCQVRGTSRRDATRPNGRCARFYHREALRRISRRSRRSRRFKSACETEYSERLRSAS